ncbi:hypothetical protein [Massilia glaciei]|uniref:Uncharacterized protein n=1 Tax=Massilia glaciei TaxID=1524097 RepID=A0A2U2HL78_9BURK|nr:hypothetical protein [Massilia glaciei]PWF48251.1 hypothetical protein C7C56_012790 [Massilia glaciei]
MKDDLERFTTVLDFVKRNQAIGILSTGATVVDYKPGLYNVSGSTDDAKEIRVISTILGKSS